MIDPHHTYLYEVEKYIDIPNLKFGDDLSAYYGIRMGSEMVVLVLHGVLRPPSRGKTPPLSSVVFRISHEQPELIFKHKEWYSNKRSTGAGQRSEYVGLVVVAYGGHMYFSDEADAVHQGFV